MLRARGMRSTPQRRAILAAFVGGAVEHLSADEVFARAAQTSSELSRGTVYATLAEFAEAGLLATYGSPEPVRYEINVDPHAHFRCRICIRTFDIAMPHESPAPVGAPFRVERIDLRVDGVCGDCTHYESGLRTGARAIARATQMTKDPDQTPVACAEYRSPVGPLLVAATANGIMRLAFPEHADAIYLHDLTSKSHQVSGAGDHLAAALDQLAEYFSGGTDLPRCEIDWSLIGPEVRDALQATLTIPAGEHHSYHQLQTNVAARQLGRIYGANPIPIFTPCHRVARGVEIPATYVGGPERRRWLDQHDTSVGGR